MGTKSRETIYGSSIRAAAERAKEARKEADRLACEAWNQRMLGNKGPAQPSPALGDALNAGYHYLEVRCLGCDTHQTVPRYCPPAQGNPHPRTGALHALQGLLAGSRRALQAQPFGRSAGNENLRQRSTWWPGER
jgi:hypothetical protein